MPPNPSREREVRRPRAFPVAVQGDPPDAALTRRTAAFDTIADRAIVAVRVGPAGGALQASGPYTPAAIAHAPTEREG